MEMDPKMKKELDTKIEIVQRLIQHLKSVLEVLTSQSNGIEMQFQLQQREYEARRRQVEEHIHGEHVHSEIHRHKLLTEIAKFEEQVKVLDNNKGSDGGASARGGGGAPVASASGGAAAAIANGGASAGAAAAEDYKRQMAKSNRMLSSASRVMDDIFKNVRGNTKLNKEWKKLKARMEAELLDDDEPATGQGADNATGASYLETLAQLRALTPQTVPAGPSSRPSYVVGGDLDVLLDPRGENGSRLGPGGGVAYGMPEVPETPAANPQGQTNKKKNKKHKKHGK